MLHHTEVTELQLSLATIFRTTRSHHGRFTQPRALRTAQSTQPHLPAVLALIPASINTTVALVIGLSLSILAHTAHTTHTALTRFDEVRLSTPSELSDGGHGHTLLQSTLLQRRHTPLPWLSALLNAMLVSPPTKTSLSMVLALLQVFILQNPGLVVNMEVTDTAATTKSLINNP